MEAVVMMEATITVREVLLLLLAADSYPCLGNGDWQVCDLMEADALKLAPRAVPSPDDPPEFGQWMEILLKPGATHPEREEICYALHELFEPEPTAVDVTVNSGQPQGHADRAGGWSDRSHASGPSVGCAPRQVSLRVTYRKNPLAPRYPA
jgi:hypothetical protein